MIVVIDKKTSTAYTYTVKSDAAKLFGVSHQTFWKWSKLGLMETPQYIVVFNVINRKNKSKVRKNGFT